MAAKFERRIYVGLTHEFYEKIKMEADRRQWSQPQLIREALKAYMRVYGIPPSPSGDASSNSE